MKKTLGVIFMSLGLLIGLLFTILQLTDPTLASNVTGFVGIMVICPLPLTVIGGVLFAIGIRQNTSDAAPGQSIQETEPEAAPIPASSLQSAFGTVGSSGSISNEEIKIERRCSVCNRTNADYLRDLKRKDPNVYIISQKFIGICPICNKTYCAEHAAYDGTIDHAVCPIHKEKLV
jgi:hypothetical protein